MQQYVQLLTSLALTRLEPRIEPITSPNALPVTPQTWVLMSMLAWVPITEGVCFIIDVVGTIELSEP